MKLEHVIELEATASVAIILKRSFYGENEKLVVYKTSQVLLFRTANIRNQLYNNFLVVQLIKLSDQLNKQDGTMLLLKIEVV